MNLSGDNDCSRGVIQCGPVTLSWDCIDAFMASFAGHTHNSIPTGDRNLRERMGTFFLRLMIVDFERGARQDLGDYLHLLPLLRNTQQLKAEDPRDLVFAMLNITLHH